MIKLSAFSILVLTNLLLLVLNVAENLFYYHLGGKSGGGLPSPKHFLIMMAAMILFSALQYFLLPGLRRTGTLAHHFRGTP
jgi:hypothetical protein